MAWPIPGIRCRRRFNQQCELLEPKCVLTTMWTLEHKCRRRILTCKHYLPTSASFEKRKMGCEMLFRGLTLNEGQEKAGEEASALWLYLQTWEFTHYCFRNLIGLIKKFQKWIQCINCVWHVEIWIIQQLCWYPEAGTVDEASTLWFLCLMFNV